MSSVLLELFRHKAWATSRLIDFCQTLDPSHLEASMPGTYGSIRATLVHLANADTNYVRRLTGEDFARLDESTALDAVAERLSTLAPRWEQILEDAALPDREVQIRDGVTRGVVVIAQALHHADDHRTQVLSILGARGIAVPELDVWAYGASAGFTRTTAEASTA
jgi:uncharacterized damage-inducible protein DinB